jgi:Spy/CpxP family protein refolding chaperone
MAAAMGVSAQDREGGFMEVGMGGGPGGGRWEHGPGRDDGLGMGPMNPRMLRELGFTPEQERRFKEQRLAFEKKKIQLHSDRAMLELDLRNVLSTYPVNQAEAVKIGEKISDLEKRAVMLRVEGLTKFLGALSAEQHRKLLDLQAELREKHRAWKEEAEKDRDGDRDKDGGKDAN